MGSECEYAISGLQEGQYLDPDDIYVMLAREIKSLRATVPDHSGHQGMFLENGGRCYLDYGSHPEYATPECFTPREVAIHDKAGEYLLNLARRECLKNDSTLQLRLIKNNVDPLEPDEHTFGNHESYTSWRDSDAVRVALVSHLVSRVLYCGSGGLSQRGIGFELSQRARHMMTVESEETTCNRAIFSTRIRKETDGGGSWTRVHLLGKDSQRAPFGIYLTYATTGLLIEMLNRGLSVGEGLALADPVAAMQTFSQDPFLEARVSLEDGRSLTALEIQREYLQTVEEALHADLLPEWAAEAVGHWRRTLDDLERNPRLLANRLDPYCKLVIYERELQRAGRSWEELRRGVELMQRFYGSGWGPSVIKAILTENPEGLDEEGQQHFAIAKTQFGDDPQSLPLMRFAMQMQSLDLTWHEADGLYDRLHAAGLMQNVICTDEEIERASRVAPAGGRAALRGEWIRTLRESSWLGDWQFVWHPPSGHCIDLRDPFERERRELLLAYPEGYDGSDVDILDLLAYPEPATVRA
jgi:proteasome accessory factor A